MEEEMLDQWGESAAMRDAALAVTKFLAFTPEGQYLVQFTSPDRTYAGGNEVTVWALTAPKKLVKRHQFTLDAQASVALSPDGKSLASTALHNSSDIVVSAEPPDAKTSFVFMHWLQRTMF